MILSASFLDQLSDRLRASLPGHDAHQQMTPRQSDRRNALSVDGRACREAGVLVLLVPADDVAAVVLTMRRDDLDDHAGQISFPGGKRENDESLLETALREAEEEIGLPRAPVRILGDLTPLFVPPSRFCVYPFVGVADSPPDLRPTDREVAEVLRAPLGHLMAPERRVVESWTLRGQDVDVPYYDIGNHVVWGATAMILAELLDVIEDVLSSPEWH